MPCLTKQVLEDVKAGQDYELESLYVSSQVNCRDMTINISQVKKKESYFLKSV